MGYYTKTMLWTSDEVDIRLGDIAEMKKPHPCGSKHFEVLRTGADIRLRCKKCARELMLPRDKAEKSIKKIIREESAPQNI